METENRTVEFLNKVYRNAQTAAESISYLTEKAEDSDFLAELKEEHSGYLTIERRAADAIAKEDALPKGESLCLKAEIWSGIQMNTMRDRTADRMAEMMITGSMMGVIGITRALKEYDEIPASAKKIGEDLIRMEEDYIQKLKVYLGESKQENRLI